VFAKRMTKVLVLTLLLSGCASDCAGDWYATGQRDGRLGATPQADIYASHCGQVDRARYAEGWESGNAMRPRTPYY
jgi:hypothetical protein